MGLSHVFLCTLCNLCTWYAEAGEPKTWTRTRKLYKETTLIHILQEFHSSAAFIVFLLDLECSMFSLLDFLSSTVHIFPFYFSVHPHPHNSILSPFLSHSLVYPLLWNLLVSLKTATFTNFDFLNLCPYPACLLWIYNKYPKVCPKLYF